MQNRVFSQQVTHMLLCLMDRITAMPLCKKRFHSLSSCHGAMEQSQKRRRAGPSEVACHSARCMSCCHFDLYFLAFPRYKGTSEDFLKHSVKYNVSDIILSQRDLRTRPTILIVVIG